MQEEGGAARKRSATMSPATEQTLETPTDTNATMQNPQNGPPMQASSSAAESDASTEHAHDAADAAAYPPPGDTTEYVEPDV